MRSDAAVSALASLAHETRLAAFRLLVRAGTGGVPAGEIAAALGLPASSLSFHLSQLGRAGLIHAERRHRSLIYRADFGSMNALVGFLTENCCGDPALCGLGPPCPDPERQDDSMTRKPFEVLFLCTGNSARSILAEAMLNQLGGGRFHARSAGSTPKGAVHPVATEVLAAYGFAAEGLRSKSWSEFAGADAPHFDFIITVCDNAAGEACPVWPGRPVTAHWGIEDPAAIEGAGQREAFVQAMRHLRRRIELLTELPDAALTGMAIAEDLARIGREPGATGTAAA